MHKGVVLFDLDGVIIDTESQYSLFWKEIGYKYLGVIDFDKHIKGLTLEVILNTYFGDIRINHIVRESIIKYEEQMNYDYIPGIECFIDDLKSMSSAIYTSKSLLYVIYV